MNKLIWVISVAVTIAVAIMYLMPKPDISLGFDLNIIPFINAMINATVSALLIVGLLLILNKKRTEHKWVMLSAFSLSAVFLILYVVYHSLAVTTKFGGEGWIRPVYFFLLISHIVLAAVILPFILITLSRALSAKYDKHRKIAKITWPLWLYVTTTGVVVYFMIAPYYK